MASSPAIAVARVLEMNEEISLRHKASVGFARQARELIISRLEDPEFTLSVSEKTSRTDVVTQIDKEVEELLAHNISVKFPDDAIIGEEFGVSGGNGLFEWVIDPIDGTTNFIYGFPAYAISIAVRRTTDLKVLSGVVLDVPRDRLYEATQSGGSFANGKKLAVTNQDNINDSLIGTGFSYSSAVRIRQGEIIASIITKIRDIRRAGAASLDLCMVAAGELDAYYEQGLKPWDYMAGSLIVTEAGGMVDGGFTAHPTEDMIVASNSKVHSGLLELIQPFH